MDYKELQQEILTLEAEVGGRSHPHHPIFNDFNFRKSAENIIPLKNRN